MRQADRIRQLRAGTAVAVSGLPTLAGLARRVTVNCPRVLPSIGQALTRLRGGSALRLDESWNTALTACNLLVSDQQLIAQRSGWVTTQHHNIEVVDSK